MKSPLQILLSVRAVGGDLTITGDKLRMRLPVDCASEFEHEIREHKLALLRLLRARFLIVGSRVLNEIVFFVSDDETKSVLVACGAQPGSVYTRSELKVLVNRRVSPQELRSIQEAKQRFNGTVAN